MRASQPWTWHPVAESEGVWFRWDPARHRGNGQADRSSPNRPLGCRLMFRGAEAEKIQDQTGGLRPLTAPSPGLRIAQMRRHFFIAIAVVALSESLAQSQSLGDIAAQD